MRAIVTWFNNGKGYGFAKPDDGSKDVFCHHSEIQAEGYRSLTEGQVIEYELGPGPNGKPQGCNIRVVG